MRLKYIIVVLRTNGTFDCILGHKIYTAKDRAQKRIDEAMASDIVNCRVYRYEIIGVKEGEK